MQSAIPARRAPGTSAQRTTTRRVAHTGLLVTEGFVALTAIAGGSALIIGALFPQSATVLNPPADYLTGTPFVSYLLPGVALALVIGGVHTVAFLLELTRNRWRLFAAATAGFAVLIWIFVQMIYIPFSFLQAVYFAAGLLEVGLTLLALGVTELVASNTGRARS